MHLPLEGFNMVVMWFSSGGTSSVLHSDEQENILSIVAGVKSLLLWSPDQAAYGHHKPDVVVILEHHSLTWTLIKGTLPLRSRSG